MTSEPKEIACLSGALQLLREARTLQELLDLQDKAQAISRYRKQADLSNSIVNEASTINLYAERRLGELLREPPANSAWSFYGNEIIEEVPE